VTYGKPQHISEWKIPWTSLTGQQEDAEIVLEDSMMRAWSAAKWAEQAGDSQMLDVFPVHYIGVCKPREGVKSPVAYGWDINIKGWRYLFTEEVLRRFFDEQPKTDWQKTQEALVKREPLHDILGAETLFDVLALEEAATPQQVRAAYRALVKRVHPDVSDEPEARALFEKVDHAYRVLRDAKKAARYRAGLKLAKAEAPRYGGPFSWGAAPTGQATGASKYQSPRRCGLVLMSVVETVIHPILLVKNILRWGDIINTQGQIMTASWEWGATEPRLEFIGGKR